MTKERELEKLQTENARLKKTVEDLWTINHLARVISSTMPVDEILDTVVDTSLKAVDAEQGTISLVNEKASDTNNEEAFKTLIRRVDTSTPGAQLRLGEKLSDWMIKNRKPLVINDVASDTTFKGLELLTREIRSILTVPLLCKGELIGVVNIFNKKKNGGFSKEDQRLLSIIASQSAQTIENARLYEEEKQLRRYEHELELARRIQHGLVPKTRPETDRLDIASHFSPADKVGGDYFDYFDFGNDRIGVVMADVSGHGPAAALVMTMVKGVLHAMSHGFESPDLVLSELNDVLNEIGPNDMFVTMVFLVFDLRKNCLQFSNAGHNPLVCYDGQSKSCQMQELPGPALSITSRAEYRIKQIDLSPGDLILIYTDGVTEAFNEQGQMFDESRLIQCVREAGAEKARVVVQKIKASLDAFRSGARQSDDIAMIALKIT